MLFFLFFDIWRSCLVILDLKFRFYAECQRVKGVQIGFRGDLGRIQKGYVHMYMYSVYTLTHTWKSVYMARVKVPKYSHPWTNPRSVSAEIVWLTPP